MNVMEDNKYVVRLTKDVIYYWQLLPWRVSIGNWEGRPLLLFSRGGGWGAAARTWYTWARLLPIVRQMNPRYQKPDPRQWRKSNLDSTKKVECRNNQFFFIDAHPWPVICTSPRASSSPVRVASEASRKTTRERATPFSPSHLICRLSFECLVTSHPPYGEFVRRVRVHLLPATKVALTLSYYFKPQKTRTTKIFFFPFTGKKRQVKYWHSRI